MSAEELSTAMGREWFTDTRTPVRRMKVAHHPGSSILVLSLWQGDHCTGTFRLPSRELARLQHLLVDAASSNSGSHHDSGASRPPTMLSRLLGRLRQRLLLDRLRQRRSVRSPVLTLLRPGPGAD